MAVSEETIAKLQSFREDYSLNAEAPEAVEEVPDTPLDTTDLTKVSNDAVSSEEARRKRAKLFVLQGGLKGVEQAKIPSITDMPTPGGISLLLLLILFVLFSFVKTQSGLTRLQLIWEAMIGNATFGAPAQNQDVAPTMPFVPGGGFTNPSMPGGVPYNWSIGT